ncbi:MAG: tetratricopeptide repeat protein [Firmicutes bacterium]|nr:tetratricopeptide repeat protein [Bacillota bacterium]
MKRSLIQLIKALSLLTMTIFFLSGCTNPVANIDPALANTADDDYTIGYANMINLDAAEKHQNTDVLYGVSKLQIMYGEYGKALETINRAMTFSNHVGLIANKVNMLERLGDYEGRDALLSQVLTEQEARYPEMDIEEKLYYNYLLITNFENELAIENYMTISSSIYAEPYLDEIYNNIGWAYLNLNDYDNALIYCTRSLEITPDDSITLSNLGNCYYGLGDYESAVVCYEESMNSDPYNSYGIYGYASANQYLENYDDAIIGWSKYIELLPDDVDGWDGLYACYLATEDLAGQENCLTTLVGLAPDVRSYVYDYLIVQQELGNPIDPMVALAGYRDAMGNFEADRLYADFTYNYVSDIEGAALYEDLLTYQGLAYTDYSALAEDVNYLGDADLLARVMYAAEGELGREARLEIEAYLYYYDEDAEQLIKVASEIIAINPESGYGYEYLGDGYYFAGDYAKAEQHYAMAVTLNEDAYYARRAQVDTLILMGKLDQANQLNHQFIDAYPDDAFGYVYQARIVIKNGSIEKAVDYLEKAISLSNYLGDIFDTYEELAPLKDRPELSSIGQ